MRARIFRCTSNGESVKAFEMAPGELLLARGQEARLPDSDTLCLEDEKFRYLRNVKKQIESSQPNWRFSQI